MTAAERKQTLVIGVGHRHRQDDGLGPYVAGALSLRGLNAVEHEGDGAGLMLLWEDRGHCILVDALGGGGLKPGDVHRFEDDLERLETASFVHSTHKVGIAEAVRLGREVACLPGSLEVIGIVGRHFGFGEELSAPVKAAAEALIEELARRLTA